MKKIIQITNNGNTIYALCEDGSIWAKYVDFRSSTEYSANVAWVRINTDKFEGIKE